MQMIDIRPERSPLDLERTNVHARHPWRIGLAVCLLSGLLLAACGQTEPDALVAQARTALVAGDRNAAVLHLKNALQANDRLTEARLLLGEIHFAKGEFAAATKELERARELGAPAESVDPRLARALLAQGEFRRVLDKIPLPEDTAKHYPELVALHARAHLGLGQDGEARRLLEALPPAHEEVAELHHARAQLWLAEQNAEAALASLDRAIALDSANSDYRLLQGDILDSLGRKADAITAYERVLEHVPGNLAAHAALARLKLHEERVEDARRHIQALSKEGAEHPLASYLRALLAYREGDHKRARDALNQFMRTSPDYPPANLLSGVVEYALGSLETAESQLKKVLTADPRHTAARRLLAAAYLQRGRVQEAQTTLQPLNPEHSDEVATVLLGAEVAKARNDTVTAKRLFARAAKLDPKRVATYTGVARLAAELEDVQGELDTEGETSVPANPTLQVTRLLRRQRYDQALALLERLDGEKRSAQLANLRGGVLLAMKDENAARKAFAEALAREPAYYPAAANLAQLDLRANDPKSARARYQGVLQAAPQHMLAMLALASIEAAAGDVDAEAAWLRKAADAHPADPEPKRRLALHHLRLNRPDKALPYAHEVYNARPRDANAVALLGQVHLAAGKFDAARDAYMRLTQLQPNDAQAHYLLGQAQSALGDSQAAIRSLDRALTLNPDHLQARALNAHLLIRQQRYEEAQRQLAQLKRAAPSDPIVLYLEGDLRLATKQPAGALTAYEQAGTLKADNTAVIKQAQALAALGRQQEAIRRLADWIAKHPEDKPTRLSYADLQSMTGNYREAIRHYRHLVRTTPDNPAVLNNLAYALAEVADKQALDYARQAQRLQPDNPTVLDTLGWAHVRLGQTEIGIEHLQRALDLAPDNGNYLYHYATALAARGDKTRAQEAIERALRSGREFPLRQRAEELHAQLSRG